MARYFIYEGNLDRLQKKIAVIERKCAKYNVHFHFEEVGEEYRKVKVNNEIIETRFVEIEVEGLMRHEGWEFIAKVDHYPQGNIIRQFKTDIEVPEKYRHTDAVCEHCNTHRGRKFTYLVHNVDTDEWKQVGSSCLGEFTHGLDAEYVAKYISLFDYIIEGEESCYTGVSYHPYYDIRRFLCYAKETVDKFGYYSATRAEEEGEISTRDKTMNIFFGLEYASRMTMTNEERRKILDLGFNADREEHTKYIEDALTWVRSLTEEETNNGYMFNLKVACSQDYLDSKNMGLVVSLMPTYYRHLKDIEYQERKKREAAENPSRYQGEIGQRITIVPKSIVCVCSNESMFGLSFLYKILDNDDNVYMWSTGTCIDPEAEIKTLTGTIKSHEEYRGVQQTFLTRCRMKVAA